MDKFGVRASLVAIGLLVASAGAQTPVGAFFGTQPGENMPEDWAPCESIDIDLRGGIEDRAWPGGVVPYEFDANVNSTNRNRALNAMAEIEAVCNVQFVPRDGEPGFIRLIASSSSNSSPVGYGGGGNAINIVSWSWRFIIVHELMHSLGINHEQSKPGRNQYVTINWDNIQEGREHNFAGSGLPVLPYNFESVMHYSSCAFTICSCSSCPTISARPEYAGAESLMGNRSYMSDGDAGTLAFLYDGPDVGDDAHEPNDSFAQASPIEPGTHALIMGDYEGDFFSFTLTETSDVTVTVTCDEGAWEATTSILDPSEQTLASQNNPIWGDGDPVTATLGVGTYVIEVDQDFGFHPYQLDLAITPTASCSDDCNDDGVVNIDDIDCFVADFIAGNLEGADCDQNGVLNVDDIDCFVASFLAGCP